MDQSEFDGLILSTKKYFINKISSNDAVAKHKAMFKSIIEKMNGKNNKKDK